MALTVKKHTSFHADTMPLKSPLSLGLEETKATLGARTECEQDFEMPKARRRPSDIKSISDHLNKEKHISRLESALNDK